MNVKTIIKNILPHFIVSGYSKRNKNLSPYSKYLEMGNSVLLPNFRIWIHDPEQNKKYVHIGNDTMLDCKILFESGNGSVIIGNNVYIGNSTIICRSKVEFENNIFVAWGVYFYDHDSHSLDYRDRVKDLSQQINDYRGGISFIQNKDWSVVGTRPIKICEYAWIGLNAIILKGVIIGKGAVVAAGSVVTKDVEPWTLVAGNPAKFVKQLEIKQ